MTTLTMPKTNLPRTQLGLAAGRPLVMLSESGLYKLVMRSDKPQAKRFQDWVTKDVLPAIRKDGGYIMGEEKVATGEMSEDELVFRAMEVMKNKIDRLRGDNEFQFLDVDEYRKVRELSGATLKVHWLRLSNGCHTDHHHPYQSLGYASRHHQEQPSVRQ